MSQGKGRQKPAKIDEFDRFSQASGAGSDIGKILP
jgi:hypothetical protein